MTVTATSGGTQAGVMCFDVTGHSADLSNFQSATNAAGDPSVTLATPAATSLGIAAFIGNAGGAATVVPAGYSSIYNGAPATNLRMCLYTDLGSPGAAQAWTTPSTDSIAFGLEIKEAGAVAGHGADLWQLAGPEEHDAAAMARAVARARHPGVTVVRLPVPLAGLRSGLLPRGEVEVDSRRFADWLTEG